MAEIGRDWSIALEATYSVQNPQRTSGIAGFQSAGVYGQGHRARVWVTKGC